MAQTKYEVSPTPNGVSVTFTTLDGAKRLAHLTLTHEQASQLAAQLMMSSCAPDACGQSTIAGKQL